MPGFITAVNPINIIQLICLSKPEGPDINLCSSAFVARWRWYVTPHINILAILDILSHSDHYWAVASTWSGYESS